VSLYTGKVRSYLRKQGIDFVEVSPGSDRYNEVVVVAVGRWIIPVVETADGVLIQDGADIIDHFEASGTRFPAYPETPVHRAISHVFEQFGGEGLLRPAMHYRWNFDEVNLAFLESEFSSGLFPPIAPEEAEAFFAHSSGRMRKAASSFGVTAESAPLIEDAFREWLTLFSDHLADHPYLLGGRPTLGDYGLIAAMWAHLFRDPAPAALVKGHAPRVGRWVERMTTSDPYESEYLRAPGDDGLILDDGVPDTLRDMLGFVADEYLPEITAHVEYANDWLAGRPDLEAGTNGLENPASRGLRGGRGLAGSDDGRAEFGWRGMTIRTGVMPYRFWLMQRLHDAVADLGDDDRATVRDTFGAAGLGGLLDLRTSRRVERVDHLEVWGPVVGDA
jgi:glutathione S-transferase